MSVIFTESYASEDYINNNEELFISPKHHESFIQIETHLLELAYEDNIIRKNYDIVMKDIILYKKNKLIEKYRWYYQAWQTLTDSAVIDEY